MTLLFCRKSFNMFSFMKILSSSMLTFILSLLTTLLLFFLPEWFLLSGLPTFEVVLDASLSSMNLAVISGVGWFWGSWFNLSGTVSVVGSLSIFLVIDRPLSSSLEVEKRFWRTTFLELESRLSSTSRKVFCPKRSFGFVKEKPFTPSCLKSYSDGLFLEILRVAASFGNSGFNFSFGAFSIPPVAWATWLLGGGLLAPRPDLIPKNKLSFKVYASRLL